MSYKVERGVLVFEDAELGKRVNEEMHLKIRRYDNYPVNHKTFLMMEFDLRVTLRKFGIHDITVVIEASGSDVVKYSFERLQ